MFETLTGDVQGPLEVKGAVKVQSSSRGAPCAGALLARFIPPLRARLRRKS